MKYIRKGALLVISTLLMLSVLCACGGTPSKETVGYSEYTGIWAEEGLDWEFGGVLTEIELNGEEMEVYFQMVGSAPASRSAEIYGTINTSEIVDNTVQISFDDDGWGTSGVLVLVFDEGVIHYEIKDVTYGEGSSGWGVFEVTGDLVANPSAYDLLDYTMEEYYERYPDECSDPTPPDEADGEVGTDTSKASGILASLGMTEEEFRNSCTPLTPDPGAHIFIDKETTAYYEESENLLRTPGDYIGQHYYLAQNYADWVICKYCNGDAENCPVGTTGLLSKVIDGVHYKMTDFLDTLEPFKIPGGSRLVNDMGETVYLHEASNCAFVIFDMRDDIYDPNITDDSKFVPYLLFIGAEGGNILKFQMISCDVIYND